MTDERRVFWMSFCDPTRPKGESFLGACLIEVTGADAFNAWMALNFLHPQPYPDSHWLAAAVTKAHALKCNPGGEIASYPLPPHHPYLKYYPFGVLMDRASITRIDHEIESANDD